VRLAIVGPPVDVWLNGERLAPETSSPGRFEVTGRLLARNEIVLHVAGPPASTTPADVPPAAVSLEISAAVDYG
jgi:hypothetical protein